MKSTAASIIIVGILISGAIMFSDNSNGEIVANGNTNNETIDTNNVSIVDGVQIVDIKVKGGYLPRKSIAKAGIPTIIRFNTSSTFDCSAFIRIPSLNVSRSLPQSGSTEINIGTPTTTDLQGSCGMGMYPFDVDFR